LRRTIIAQEFLSLDKSIQSDTFAKCSLPSRHLYFTRRKSVVIVLLCGGDKSTQRKDMRRAQRMANEIGDDI
jgi:hypothetical protein